MHTDWKNSAVASILQGMKTYTYTIQLELAEEGGYVVSVPVLPGCFTQGETYEEAVEMAKDAIKCHIEGLLMDGLPVPEEDSQTIRLERVSIPV